jgi:hypothetical protein
VADFVVFGESSGPVEVFGESSGPVEPGEGGFHDPAFGQDLKAFPVAAFDDLDGVAEPLFCPADQGSRVAAIREDGGDGIEPAEQPHEHGASCGAILDPGRMHDRREQVALRIYRDVTLAALDLFACVVSPLPPFSAVLAD